MSATSDWGELVDRHADKAYCFALGLCGNDDGARDLVQGAFTKAFENIEDHDPAQSFEGWLLTILKHIFLDGARRYERRYALSLDDVNESGLTVADAVADSKEPSILDQLEKGEAVAALRRAMAQLTTDARAVLMLIDLEGLSYDAAAQVMGCPINTIRSRIIRARYALRKKLESLEGMT